ncbi:MAG: CYTH domain-containing protein [Patescibacteria group bacterium]
MNKTNLELKHFCSDFLRVRKELRKIGAKKEVVKKQVDYFFEIPKKSAGISPRLKLRVEGKLKTLIYYERPDFAKAKDTTSDIKLYDVKDNDLLSFLERSLGVKAIVDKKREVWRKTNTVFHLDNIKGVGGIFEIELQKKGKISEKDRKLFAYYQNELLPYLGNVIKGSNADLVKKK